MLLENKNAVVYGGGGAVGSAVAKAFAREGAKVFLAGRTLTTLESVAADISRAGGTADVATVNALDGQAVEQHLAAVARKCGRIDILFNAMGMEDVQGTPLVDMSLDDFMHPIMTAAQTHFLTARAVARRMQKQRSGVIMTITAGPAREATANIGGFGAACEAVEGLWRNLAAELGSFGIRLICIRSAGSPDTPAIQAMLGDHADAETFPGFGHGTLLRRLPLVGEVADVAAMMASDRASALTGSYINVTCGSHVE